MSGPLAGQNALVTGSTAGIGLAIARRLGAEGAAVVVNGRTRARVDAAAAAVREAGGASVRGVVADLATAAGAAALTREVPDVDILVNNLGVYPAQDFLDITDADWTALFETNVMSGVRLARHYVRGMLARDRGRMVFIASESAVLIPTEMIHYGVTKAAQVALARGLAQVARGTGVTVNSVLAGPTRSEGVERFIGELAAAEGVSAPDFEPRFFRDARPGSLIRRFLDPDEIAAATAFLCRPEAGGITGSALRAEGGLIGSAF